MGIPGAGHLTESGLAMTPSHTLLPWMGTQRPVPSLYPVLTCSGLHLPRDKLQKNKAFLAPKEPLTSIFSPLVLCVYSWPFPASSYLHWNVSVLTAGTNAGCWVRVHTRLLQGNPPRDPEHKGEEHKDSGSWILWGERPLSYTLRSALEETGKMPASSEGGWSDAMWNLQERKASTDRGCLGQVCLEPPRLPTLLVSLDGNSIDVQQMSNWPIRITGRQL